MAAPRPLAAKSIAPSPNRHSGIEAARPAPGSPTHAISHANLLRINELRAEPKAHSTIGWAPRRAGHRIAAQSALRTTDVMSNRTLVQSFNEFER